MVVGASVYEGSSGSMLPSVMDGAVVSASLVGAIDAAGSSRSVAVGEGVGNAVRIGTPTAGAAVDKPSVGSAELVGAAMYEGSTGIMLPSSKDGAGV